MIKHFINNHHDIIQVIVAGGSGVGAMFLNIEIGLRVAIGVITLAYILRKWYLMEKRK